MVDTSVAVAIPSTTALRMTSGSSSAGRATTKLRPICAAVGAATAAVAGAARQRATPPSAADRTSAGNGPPVNSAATETSVTDPIVISTRLGGIVSDIAAEVESSATSSP